jgi:hypothetical protein
MYNIDMQEKDPLEALVVANSTILEKYPQPAII